MKAGWRKANLGAAFTTVTGSTPSKGNASFYGRFIPLVKPPELQDSTINTAEDGLSETGAHVARIAPPHSILVSCIGNLGKIGFNEVPVAFNQQINAILPDREKAIPEFLFYQALSPSFLEQLEGLASGTTVPIVNKSKFNSIEIVLPPLPEQQRIVGILDEAFDGIATAKANAEKNLQNARALFESYLQAVFASRAEGWRSVSVKQLVDEGVLEKPQDGNHGEIHPTRADYVDAGVPFVMAADMQDGKVNTFDCRFIAESQARSLRIGFAKSGDVLLSHKGTIGRVAVLHADYEFVVLTPQVTYYRVLDERKLLNKFLYYCFLSPAFQAELNQIAGGGSTRAYIGITRQLDLRLVVPPIGLQRTFAARLAELSEENQRLESLYQRKLAALDELKKSLLHQAFSGRL